jgi:hypothetical protein
MKKLFLLLIGIGLFYTFSTRACAGIADVDCVQAVQPQKIDWCHCEPNGNCQTLSLPQQALENAGHVNAQGNPLHAGDYAGVCRETEPTVTPTLTPNPTLPTEPTITIEPTNSPTTQVSTNPTVTSSSVVHPTATPFNPTPTPFHPTPTDQPICTRMTKGGICL